MAAAVPWVGWEHLRTWLQPSCFSAETEGPFARAGVWRSTANIRHRKGGMYDRGRLMLSCVERLFALTEVRAGGKGLIEGVCRRQCQTGTEAGTVPSTCLQPTARMLRFAAAFVIEFCIGNRAIARIPPHPALSPNWGRGQGEGDGSELLLLAMQNSIAAEISRELPESKPGQRVSERGFGLGLHQPCVVGSQYEYPPGYRATCVRGTQRSRP
jgi:hypothetical protein